MSSTVQIFFYALRPGFVRSQRLTKWHYLNIVTQLAFDAVLVAIVVRGLVGDGVEPDRACAAGEEEACARALESKAAARLAWLAFEGDEPPADAFFGGISVLPSSEMVKWYPGKDSVGRMHTTHALHVELVWRYG